MKVAMNSLAKVLVVDHGDRSSVDPLSLELAELGFASVTVSLEAAEQVLAVLSTPSAILLRMPTQRAGEYHAFLVLADKLRRDPAKAAVPVVLWDGSHASAEGGLAGILRRAGSRASVSVDARRVLA